MNACTRRSLGPKIPIKLPTFTPDKRLAFVENVCRVLIEDRFGPWGFADAWMVGDTGLFGRDKGEIDLRDKPRFAPPVAASSHRGLSVAIGSRMRIRALAFIGKFLSTVSPPRFPIIQSPQGSPFYLGTQVSTGNGVTGDFERNLIRTLGTQRIVGPSFPPPDSAVS
jgi:hypothetical protein